MESGLNLLWMDEDELRASCRELLACLFRKEIEVRVLLAEVERAAVDGYKYGYADGVADRALQLPLAVKEGDAESFVLH